MILTKYFPVFLQMASRQDVIDWVSRSWDAVSEQVVKTSFLATGISAETDGSEDHLLTNKMASALNEADRQRVDAGEQQLAMLFNEEGSDSEIEFEGFE